MIKSFVLRVKQMLQYLSNKIRISDIHLKIEFNGYDENDKKVTKKFEF